MQISTEILQKAFAFSLSTSHSQITEATSYLKQVVYLLASEFSSLFVIKASGEKSYIPCLLQLLVNPSVKQTSTTKPGRVNYVCCW